MKTRRVVAALLMATALTGAGAAVYSQATATTTSGRVPAADSGAPAGLDAARVQVQAPVRRTLERSVELPGTLVAYAAAALYPKASGYVGEVSVDIGDHVRKGDALVRLDVPEMADELRHSRAALHTRRAELAAAQARVSLVQQSVPRATAEVQRAEAEVTLKRITAQRTEALAREQALPQQQLDEASAALAIAEGALAVARARLDELAADAEVHRAAVGVAEGNVEAAEASLARLETLSHYATVTAPFDGVITERLVDPGAFVRSAGDGGSMPVLRLAALDRLRLVVDVAEPDVPPVRPGCAAEATCGTTQVHAVVSRIAGALRPETRTMRAEIDLDNPDGQMLPGSYARVRLTLQSRDDAMMLPARAIRSAAGRTFVLVARDGRAEEAAVEVGYTDGAWTEVRSGLRDDDMVIVAAPSGVTAGSLVEAVSVEAGQGGAK